jgi:hypothetical protein
MHWEEAFKMGFYGICSLSSTLLIYLFREVKNDLKETKNSIMSLNTNIAVLLERTTGHEKLIDNHGHRITRLEGK